MNLSDLIDRLSGEPVAVGAVILAVLQLLVAFGVPMTDDQQHAILGLVAATLAIAAIVRQKVTPA